MSFHVGQLVVRVEGEPLYVSAPGVRNGYGDEVLPKKGTVYTVRRSWFAPEYNKPVLLVVEIVNRERGYLTPQGRRVGEPYWPASQFRPVDEKRIEVFRKIAANPRIEVEA